MFPKKHRLTQEWEIKRVFKKGKRIESPLFSLWFFPTWFDHTRATVTVSKKYDKRAVHRNRLKRLFREAAHHMIISLSSPADIIILPKHNSGQSSFQEIEIELQKVFESLPEKIETHREKIKNKKK